MLRVLIAFFVLAATARAATITVVRSGNAQGPFALDVNGASVSFGAFTQTTDLTFMNAEAILSLDVPMSLTFSDPLPSGDEPHAVVSVMLTIDGLQFTIAYDVLIGGVGGFVEDLSFDRCCGVPGQWENTVSGPVHVIPSGGFANNLTYGTVTAGETAAGTFPVQFVVSELPEPTSYSLMAFGITALALRQRCVRRTKSL